MQPFAPFKLLLLLVTFLLTSTFFCICSKPVPVLHVTSPAPLPLLKQELLLVTWTAWLQWHFVI
jgi:hypothetical protein